MGKYTQLTREQRYQISGLKKTGMNQRQIAEEVGVNKSTLSRELRRNEGQRGWRPKQAQETAEARRRGRTNAERFSPESWRGVEELIRTARSFPIMKALRRRLKQRSTSRILTALGSGG